jgi:hypothetical protein
MVRHSKEHLHGLDLQTNSPKGYINKKTSKHCECIPGWCAAATKCLSTHACSAATVCRHLGGT